ncbi:hypothetical protein [Streptomyces sp. TRM68367]|uniref:hypothetical protein n=1 Tax=Streptomyces sp. TRM68367 TaxID=2758415 RepID=UPI00165A8D93|nr:hypothetical protein [Streptomyces sp. TRM68367]MBC9731148.1 hypothetical protein [Streptomyces sp. TRM68367]
MPASPRQRLSAAERRKQALQAFLAGMDLRTIAQQVGYADASAAKKAIDRAIQESIAREEADIDELRQLEVLRYDRLQAAWWSAAIGKDRSHHAARIVLECIRGRSRLTGVEAPRRINLDAQKLGDEILALMEEMRAEDDDG